jgi:putative membrane protein
MGYFSLSVAKTMLGNVAESPNGRLELVAVPLAAAFIMTQWDLVMDPSESTIARAWIGHDGGSDFGVPLSNYLGWFFTSWLFYQAFVLYLRFERATHKRTRRPVHELQLVAILFYACSDLTHVTPWLLDQRGEISGATGQLWRIHDLRATAVLIVVFTMLFSSSIALLRLAADSSLRKIDCAIPRMGECANDSPENKVTSRD